MCKRERGERCCEESNAKTVFEALRMILSKTELGQQMLQRIKDASMTRLSRQIVQIASHELGDHQVIASAEEWVQRTATKLATMETLDDVQARLAADIWAPTTKCHACNNKHFGGNGRDNRHNAACQESWGERDRQIKLIATFQTTRTTNSKEGWIKVLGARMSATHAKCCSMYNELMGQRTTAHIMEQQEKAQKAKGPETHIVANSLTEDSDRWNQKGHDTQRAASVTESICSFTPCPFPSFPSLPFNPFFSDNTHHIQRPHFTYAFFFICFFLLYLDAVLS